MNLEKLNNIIEAVVYISKNAAPNPVRGAEIAKSMQLPERYFEADLQKLARAGVLKSMRGPKGGYVLAKERRNINLKNIYDAFEAGLNSKVLQPAVKAFEAELANVTLQEIAQPKKEDVDFDI